MRYAARRDLNEPQLVEAARKAGFKVFYLRELGDLLVQFHGITELWEVKQPKGKLTPAQVRMREAGLEARIVRSVEDVISTRIELLAQAAARH